MGDAFVQRLRVLFGLNIIEDTDLEIFCKAKYPLISNIAYTNKRKIASLSYSVFLNEIITPRAFEIAKLKKGVLLTEDRFQRVRNLGNVVAKRLTWTDDKNLDTSGDYYLYPSEALILKKCDCEDHAFIMASALPDDLGVAYGFWDDGKGQRYGHAFNVFLLDGALWTLDTVGNLVDTKRVEASSPFKIHYILTERYTFQVRGGVQFGEIAGYD